MPSTFTPATPSVLANALKNDAKKLAAVPSKHMDEIILRSWLPLLLALGRRRFLFRRKIKSLPSRKWSTRKRYCQNEQQRSQPATGCASKSSAAHFPLRQPTQIIGEEVVPKERLDATPCSGLSTLVGRPSRAPRHHVMPAKKLGSARARCAADRLHKALHKR